MSAGTRIALVGDAPEMAEHLVRALLERGFDLRDVRVLGSPAREGEVVEAGAARLRTDRMDALGFSGATAALFFGASSLASQWIDQVPDDCLAVDATPGACLRNDGVPIVPEVNAEVIGAAAAAGPLALASPATAGLAVVLAPLHEAARVRRVVTTVLAPASVRETGGVERLSRQSVSLMQGLGLDEDEDPEHLAFNLRPFGPGPGTPWAADELLVARECAALFGEPPVEVMATFVRAPVFYGMAQCVFLETEDPLALEDVHRLLQQGRGLVLAGAAADDTAAEPGIAELADPSPGPVDILGSDAVHVARVRLDPARPGSIALWLCFDDQRKAVASNAVATLEVALRDARA